MGRGSPPPVRPLLLACCYKASWSWRVPTVPLLVPGRMELGLSLGETMADAGRDLVLGLGMGAGARRDEEAEPGRRELEFGAGGAASCRRTRRCGSRSYPDWCPASASHGRRRPRQPEKRKGKESL